MTVVSYRKKVIKKRRRFIPRKRILKTKSLIPKRTIYIHKGRFRLFKHRTQRARLFEKRFNTFVLPRGPTKSYSQDHTPKKPTVVSSWDLNKIKKTWQTEWGKKMGRWGLETQPPEPEPPWQKNAFEKEKKKAFKKKKERIPKKFDRRIGADWSKHRKYENFGPSRRLGPHDVLTIEPTIKFLQTIKMEQGSWTRGWMSTAVKSSIDMLRNKLLEHADMIINSYVPKETGTLQESLLKELNRRQRQSYRLEVKIGTPMMGRKTMIYASPVNRMSEDMIRHHGNKKGRISRKLLYDPKAQEGWYEKIRMKLNNHLKKVLIPAFYQNLIKDAIKKTGIGMIPKYKGIKGSDHEKWLIEKKKTEPFRMSELRKRAELARKKDKLKKPPYGKIDVMKWFKIELPFKR